MPADIAEYRVEADDIYLLCSDGLTDMVDADVVHTIVDEQRADARRRRAAELVELANQNGGRDNISVILVRVPRGVPARRAAGRSAGSRRRSGQ